MLFTILALIGAKYVEDIIGVWVGFAMCIDALVILAVAEMLA